MAVNMSVRSRPSIHEKVLNVNITLSETNYKATSQENGESHSQSEESNIESGTKCEDNMKDESPKGMPQIGRTSAKTRKSPSPSKVSEIASNNLDQEHTNTGILPSVVTNRSVIVAVAAVCVYIAYGQFNSEKTCSFKELKVKYPQLGNKVWHTLQFGIEPILNKKERNAAVYLFAHHGGITAQEVIKEIASYTSGCYGNSLVEMEKNDFTSSEAKKDYGHAIEKYKMKIKEGKVVLIANLNEIPAEVAKAFHSICDVYSPIAPDVVIFLTLRIPAVENECVDAIVEDTLNELWGSKLLYNELDPLITRVTDQVILLKI